MSGAVLRDFMHVADQKVILVYDFMRMWIFLIELIDRTDEIIESPMVAMSVGIAPTEDSKISSMDLEEEEEDLFGELDEDYDDEFNDFEDGFDDEDLSSFDEYNY
jgi:hypothetical protein